MAAAQVMRRTVRSAAAAAAAAAALAIVLAGCATAPAGDAQPAVSRSSAEAPASDAGAASDLLAAHDLEDGTAAQLIDRLEAVPLAERAADLLASVRGDVLLLADAEQEQELPMPEDRTYISIAPYVSQTHECTFHSLTTCVGELRNEHVQVTITDDATGRVLVDGTVETHDNGFVGFWLPRDLDGTIAVEHAAGSGSVPFSTAAGAPTCITTLALA